MKTPLWETSAGALVALLNSRAPLEKADLYTITLASGTVLRWSGHDARIAANGRWYELGPGLRRTNVRWATGIEVDTMSLTLYTDAARPNPVGGVPLLQYIRQGGFYGARVQLERAFAPKGAAGPTGTLLWFTGNVADVRIGRYEAQLSIKSDLEKLNVMVPRDVYQAGCLNTLFDAACGLGRAAWQISGSASGASDVTRTTFPHALAQAAGYFDLGVVQFTSGANSGVMRTIKRHLSGSFTVLQPLPAAVTGGDAFIAWPGCDKLNTTCSAKFSNAARFRGHPYIPMAETIT
jgi:uncharacterized phage protein (TIGR02218 family)